MPLTELEHTSEIAFGAYGGAELFFADIDGDGQLEILAYQGPGVFGTRIFHGLPAVAAHYPTSTCLSAFKKDGRRLWTFGTPNDLGTPYISHAHESCVATGDVDGDGTVEIALADGDRVLLIDGPTGELRRTAMLPEDNFFIVQILGSPTAPNEAAVVVKNGETGYGTWSYGEPVLGLNARMEPAWPGQAIPGGGHHILVLDTDQDGRPEYLTGYCMVKPSGEWTCIVDAVAPASVNAGTDHVDYTDVLHTEAGGFVLGIAGSSRAYLVNDEGKTLFHAPDKHVQGSALGRFRNDSDYQLAIYNDDGPMVLYEPDGNELWRVSTSDRESWPLGMPEAAQGHRFHRNRPIMTLPTEPNHILFTDGGWPWAMDGDAGLAVTFVPPAASRQPEMEIHPQARADDMGYGFATKIVDWNGDGNPEAVIYDRRYLWSFPL
ncbi:MAG: hypothetical protein HN742_26210 [Lentisphaerae bacterium]|jgi:hypothetical protein|nr:hypothetical protein [Lentisphaerota bacterium]MBT4815597.1 hypothetical protein [Lentisphaerota bacterium]MBT5605541.1 hypothetical protein [Lentisphaerota bacterium]MBT7056818.1 hypothetical protein [Lentisphaerota bacterium]MBT7845396.1 hypothetical protein [Lentisphaerota bacterium]